MVSGHRRYINGPRNGIGHNMPVHKNYIQIQYTQASVGDANVTVRSH